jgi:hypothetical protein
MRLIVGHDAPAARKITRPSLPEALLLPRSEDSQRLKEILNGSRLLAAL